MRTAAPRLGRGGASAGTSSPCRRPFRVSRNSSSLPHALLSSSLPIPSRCPRRREWCWPASPAMQGLRLGGASRSCCLWEPRHGTSVPQSSSICAFVQPGRCSLGGVAAAGLPHRRRHGRGWARRLSAPPALAAVTSGYFKRALPRFTPFRLALLTLARARESGSSGADLDGVCNGPTSCNCACCLCFGCLLLRTAVATTHCCPAGSLLGSRCCRYTLRGPEQCPHPRVRWRQLGHHACRRRRLDGVCDSRRIVPRSRWPFRRVDSTIRLWYEPRSSQTRVSIPRGKGTGITARETTRVVCLMPHVPARRANRYAR